jgi:ABC-type transport system involved in multi-copper enzyme maturation permease subunit
VKTVALLLATVREMITRVTLIVLGAISTFILLFVLAAVSLVVTPEGSALAMFGTPVTPPAPAEQVETLVSGLQASLAGGLFFGVILFGTFATAGVVPETLERGIIDIYLSKPLDRWQLLLGRSLGAVLAIVLHIAYFLGVLWLICGIRLGVWNPAIFLVGLTMAYTFACLFSILVLTGVATRTSAVPIITAFLYLLIIGSLLHHREQSLYLISENAVYRWCIDGLYYVLPQLSELREATERLFLRQDVPWRPYVQSLASSAALFTGAAYLFRRKDF